MQTIKINNDLYSIPGNWNELSLDQLLLVVRLFISGKSKTQILLRTLLYILGLQVLSFKTIPSNNGNNYLFKVSKKKKFLLTDTQLLYLIENTLTFLIGENIDEAKKTKTIYIDTQLTDNLLPSFKIGFTVYYGPSDNLFNLTFKEFILAETYFSNYTQNSDQTSLNKLIATLYRPKSKTYNPHSPDYKGDIREPFNDFLIEMRSKDISKLPMIYKVCITLYYQGSRRWLMKHFPHVFSGSSSKKDPFGYMSLVDSLTGGDVTKTDVVRNSMLYDVMLRLERAAIEFEERKSKT